MTSRSKKRKRKSAGVTLAYFEPNAENTVLVDASSRGLGAVRLQNGKPIAFASKSLSGCEQRYANIERASCSVWLRTVPHIRLWKAFHCGIGPQAI